MGREQQPMTDADLEAFREEMEKQGKKLRDTLAEDLGGTPDEYWQRSADDDSE